MLDNIVKEIVDSIYDFTGHDRFYHVKIEKIFTVKDESVTVYFTTPTVKATNSTFHMFLRETSHVCVKNPLGDKLNTLELQSALSDIMRFLVNYKGRWTRFEITTEQIIIHFTGHKVVIER